MRSSDKPVNIGLLGLGVVGGGVLSALSRNASAMQRSVGCPIQVTRILVKDPDKPRAVDFDRQMMTSDAALILEDATIDIVAEAMGGEQPALDYIRTALDAGKSVVTANKEVMAKHGPELLEFASRRGAHLLFEASVGGGIPILGPLTKSLRGNEINGIRAIINGTTNYILTKMSQEGVEFSEALREAQQLGYAEADPTNDVEGIDAGYKLAILASLAFHCRVASQDIHLEGISRLAGRDFRYASELGYVIKLMAIASSRDGSVEARVHPALLPQDAPLAKVDGVLNAVEVQGDLVDKVLFQGRGAGSMPTASAMVGDILEVASSIANELPAAGFLTLDREVSLCPISDLVTRYYIRATVLDRAGVLAQMAAILGNLQISIASVIQKEVGLNDGTAELVITTYPSQERDVQQALRELEKLDVVKEIGNLLRVEE